MLCYHQIMDIHYVVRQGEVLPYLESFQVMSQREPCPPGIFEVLQHKIIADVSKNPGLRHFQFPFTKCPIRVTLDVRPENDK